MRYLDEGFIGDSKKIATFATLLKKYLFTI